MNKIAQYLNEHLLGEVTADDAIRDNFSHDASILSIKPELVIHPRVTNDIRKIARFAWQLAEKGHVLPITMRGSGSDKTGGAIGSGILINTPAHLNKVIFVSTKAKNQFIHLQPGVSLATINEALKATGMLLPTYYSTAGYETIGGAVANNLSGIQSGLHGSTGDWVERLEVVLANGDLIETTRISKGELNKKKGLQTFEGEIYRKVDAIIDDNKQTIDDKIANEATDNTGYPGIAKVKNRDGSFDLTPLLVGSQGTLGLISEIVMRTTFYSTEESIIVATFDNPETARDAADTIVGQQPTILEVIDGQLFDTAHNLGKKYIFSEQYLDRHVGTIMYISFNDISDHTRHKKTKHVLKLLSKVGSTVYTNPEYMIEELQLVCEVESILLQNNSKGESQPPIIDGASVPGDRREEFIVALDELANKHHISLPLHIRWLDDIIYTRPVLKLHEVSDKQKTFKLINDYLDLVIKFGGSMCADACEGRLKAGAAYARLDDDELDIYKQIKDVFDPLGILNTGVKQKSDLKTLVSALDPDYSIAEFAKYSPSN
ncbi:FAD-binding oxidoreductase [Candidatus Saccharibacteria bacterium]|nr:FAD-binding oxidoreductase [Candidatus Saccharibacteria bacterium]